MSTTIGEGFAFFCWHRFNWPEGCHHGRYFDRMVCWQYWGAGFQYYPPGGANCWSRQTVLA
jgi:hypothetical protein